METIFKYNLNFADGVAVARLIGAAVSVFTVVTSAMKGTSELMPGWRNTSHRRHDQDIGFSRKSAQRPKRSR
jgi:hypothetical protein